MQITTFPLVRAGLFFMAGLGLHDFLPIIPVKYIGCLFFMYLVWTWFTREKIVLAQATSYFLLLLIFTAGAGWIQQHHETINRRKLPLQICTLQGVLTTDPKQKTKSISAELDVHHVLYNDGRIVRFRGKLLVYVSLNAGTFLDCRQGDQIRVTGRISEIRPVTNPGAFDFRKFCFYKGITQQMYVQESAWQLLSKADLRSFTGFAAFCRERWAKKFDAIISDNEAAGVIKALLLGVNDDVSTELYQSFSKTGVIHVLSVSGLHVGAVMYVFVLFFKRFKRHQFVVAIVQPIVLFAIALFYVLLTGASPSIVRSVIMFVLILTGRIWFRGGQSINILMVSAIWMLLYDPDLLYNLSFQFSYLSLGSILLFQPVIRLWYIPDNKVTAYIWELVSVSVAAQALVFPLAVYYFNQFPVYFAIANIVAIPLGILLVYGGFLVLFLNEVINYPLIFMQNVYTKTTRLFIDSIQWMASWPGAGWDNLYVEKPGVFGLFVIIIMLYVYIQTRNRAYFFVTLCFVFAMFIYQLYCENMYQKQSLLCLYDSNKETLVDFIDGRTAFFLKSENVTLKTEDQVCRKNRLRRGVRNTIYCSDTLRIEGRFFTRQRDDIYFKDKKVRIAGKGFSPIKSSDPVDILIVSRGCPWPGHNFFALTKKPLIILAGNLYKKERDQWTACLEESRIGYRDVRREGYIELDLNQPGQLPEH